MRRHALWVGLIALAACASCKSEPDESSRRQAAATGLGMRPLDASSSPWGRAARRVAALEPVRDWEILDVAADGSVLYGHRQVDESRYYGQIVFALKLLAPPPSTQPTAVGRGPVVDAALSPASGHPVAWLSPDGDLVLEQPGQMMLPLDAEVVPGLGFSPDGARLAYAKGTRPELDIYYVPGLDEATGRGARAAALVPVRLTADDAADTLPAVGRDGRVLWVSARTGISSLWITGAAAGGERQVTNAGLVVGPRGDVWRATSPPDARRPPLWARGYIVYQHGPSVTIVAEATGAVVGHLPAATQPHWLERGREFAVLEGSGSYAAVRLPATAGEVSP